MVSIILPSKWHNLRFDIECGLAGTDWLKGFLKRHPGITYKKLETISVARAMDFSRVTVGNFFEPLENIYDKDRLNP